MTAPATRVLAIALAGALAIAPAVALALAMAPALAVVPPATAATPPSPSASAAAAAAPVLGSAASTASATLRPAAAPVRRIVSLLPSLTESVCAIGACDLLVATDRYSDWPASVRGLPKLGGIDDAQIERIVALRPDLVLASASARSTDRLRGLGIEVMVLASDNRADVRRGLVALAARLGRGDAATSVWARIEADVAAATRRVPPAVRGRRVYFEVDAAPYAAGADSFIGETLAALGLVNAVPAALGAFPRLGPEYVVRLQPDIVMATERAVAEMPRRPGWAALRALREHRTCAFPADRYELLVRPGPRLGEAAAVIADCLSALATADATRR